MQHVDRFAEHCPLQSVGDVTEDFLVQADRGLAEALVERLCPFQSLRAGQRAARHFHQRDQVRRVEGMAQNHPFGMPTVALHRRDVMAEELEAIRMSGRTWASISASRATFSASRSMAFS